MKPRLTLDDETAISAQDLAAVLDVTPKTIRQLAQEGVVQRAGTGRYLVIASTRNYVRYLRGQIAAKRNGQPDDQGQTWEHWRAMRMRAAAETLQIDLEQKRGKLLTAREVELAWSDLFATIRAQLLSWAARLSPRTFSAGPIEEHRKIHEEEVHAILTQIAGGEVAVHTAKGDE